MYLGAKKRYINTLPFLFLINLAFQKSSLMVRAPVETKWFHAQRFYLSLLPVFGFLHRPTDHVGKIKK